MKRLTDYLFVRHRHNWVQLIRFGLVGGSGVLVNMFVVIVCNKVGPDLHGVVVDLPLSPFNVRWYHVYISLAFLLANVWNFQLNRWWTFRSARATGWWREYWPFLSVGLVGLLMSLGVTTLLLNPESPLALPTDVLDSSSGLRNPFYWANLISIALVTPASFVLNKLWTFKAVRRSAGVDDDPTHPVPVAPTRSNEDETPLEVP